MNLDEMKQTWTEHTVKLDRLLKLNLQALQSAHIDKSRSALGRYKMHRVIELIPGVVCAGLLGAYIVHRLTVPTLAIPAVILIAFIGGAIAGCVRQLILLHQISYTDPVTTIQAKLEAVKLHLLDTSRLMILSLPFYFVYLVLGSDLLFGVDILARGDWTFLYANAALSLAFFAPALWIFRNLNFRNADHPVIRVFINGAGGKQLLAAMDFLDRIEKFKADERN